jgi:hypothetical protein
MRSMSYMVRGAYKAASNFLPIISEANHMIRKGNYLHALDLITQQNVNTLDENGESVLSTMIKHSFHCVTHLVKHYNADPNIYGSDGNTPLLNAILYKQHEFVEPLLSCGANPNLAHKITGDAPLHQLAKQGNFLQALNLIKYGVNIDTEKFNHNSKTPLAISIQYEHHTFAAFLISMGARIDPKILDNNIQQNFLHKLFEEMAEIDQYCATHSVKKCLKRAEEEAYEDGIACARILVNVKEKLRDSNQEISKHDMKQILQSVPAYNVYAKFALRDVYDPTIVAMEISRSELLGHLPDSLDFSVS